MARKKGGQQLVGLGKRKPKIKVDLTPRYRPKPPPRGKRTKGPSIKSPTRPPGKIIRGPGLWGPPDKEGRIKPRNPRKRRLSPVIVPGTERMRGKLKNQLGVQPRQFGARMPRGTRSPAVDTSMLLSPFGAAAEAKSRRKNPRKRVY